VKEGVWHGMMLVTGVAIAALLAYSMLKEHGAIAPPPAQQCSCGCEHPEPVSYIMG